jgi:hypothetical protein
MRCLALLQASQLPAFAAPSVHLPASCLRCCLPLPAAAAPAQAELQLLHWLHPLLLLLPLLRRLLQ